MISEGLANRKSLEPWIKDEVVYYPHQVEGIRTLARRRSFILGDDMGLGKSLQAMTIFAIDVYRGWVSKMLVVCPATLKGNWADEIEKFTRFPYVVVDGETPFDRMKQLLEFDQISGPKILVVNYEQVIGHQGFLDKQMFDVTCFDEAHYMKNPEAKRTEACIDLYGKRSFMLTGTPLLNHINELYTLLYRIGAYTKGYYQFINRYAVMGGYKNKQIVGVKNEPELRALLDAYMVRRLKSEVLDLPDVQYIERGVDLYPEQQRLYDQVMDDLKLTRYNFDKPDDIENALTKFLRLKQICGTTLQFTGEDVSSKLDLAILDDTQILENKERVVVFTQFRDVQAAYAERLERVTKGSVPIYQLHGGITQSDRQPIVKEWGQTKTAGVLVCMIQVAGVGLNMTQARHANFLDQLFTPGMNQQAVDRLHRIGASETQPVQVRQYVVRHTVEQRVKAILNEKMKVHKNIIEGDPTWKKRLMEEMMKDVTAHAA